MIPTWGASAGFNVFSLFSNGEQGGWYDPSDFSTLYQDAAGTTPVTAVEQAVGLMLDKRLGLPLGTQLVVNPTFDTDSDWTKGPGWSIGSGVATKTPGSGGNLSQTVTLTVGVTYRIVFTMTRVAGTLTPRFSGGTTVTGTVRSASGTYVQFLTAVTGNNTLEFNADPTFDGTVDDVYMRPVSGNDAAQSTLTARPILRARYNSLTYSEQFDNAIWTKTNTSITQDQIVAPDGTTTADLISSDTTSGSHIVFQSATPAPIVGAFYSISVYVKAGTQRYIQFGDRGDSVWRLITFDFNTNTITNTTNVTSSSVQSIGDGWYRLRITATRASASGSYQPIVTFSNVSNANSPPSYIGSTADNFYAWGAQIMVGNDFAVTGGAYQRIADSATYATTSTMGGYQFLPYLFFDGVDDGLQTQSVNLTGTDKSTSWSGVTKLADSAVGIIAEFDFRGGVGAFGQYVSTLGRYAAFSEGTTIGEATSASSSYPVPITNVVTQIGDIANDISILRVNGVQAASSTSDQGTGNYSNSSINIGRRSGGSFPMNGRIYSLIVRGAESDASQIAATEAYVASKCGVVL